MLKRSWVKICLSFQLITTRLRECNHWELVFIVFVSTIGKAMKAAYESLRENRKHLQRFPAESRRMDLIFSERKSFESERKGRSLFEVDVACNDTNWCKRIRLDCFAEQIHYQKIIEREFNWKERRTEKARKWLQPQLHSIANYCGRAELYIEC